MIKEDAEEEVRDAGLIAAAQRVEHYEMAGYGCARTYAELLGDPDGAQLLQTTLTEESDTDKKLTKLSQFRNQHRGSINKLNRTDGDTSCDQLPTPRKPKRKDP